MLGKREFVGEIWVLFSGKAVSNYYNLLYWIATGDLSKCNFLTNHRHAMFLQTQCGVTDNKSEAIMIFCSLTDMLKTISLLLVSVTLSSSYLTKAKHPNQQIAV